MYVMFTTPLLQVCSSVQRSLAGHCEAEVNRQWFRDIPTNASNIGTRANPSDTYSHPNTILNTSPHDSYFHPSSSVLSIREQRMEREMILHFKEQLAEGYDLVYSPPTMCGVS